VSGGDPSARSAGGKISAALLRVMALRAQFEADGALRDRWHAVKRFQAQRLRATYPDLLASSRFRPACEFFLDELYGAHDFEARDSEALRAVSKLEAFLPARALHTIADAVELDELSERLDGRLAAAMSPQVPTDAAAFAAAYADAYRTSATPQERTRQLDCVITIGHSLDALARIKLLPRLLGLMRRPAEAAGLGHLHHFLASGFEAFRDMKGAADFLAIVHDREAALMMRLFSGAGFEGAHPEA